MPRFGTFFTAAAAALAFAAAAQAEPAVDRAVWGDLAKLAGRSFVGAPVGGSSETGVDRDRWEWALGGTALRRTHAVGDGGYAGETLIYWDAADRRLEYVYVTNQNFRTEGVFFIEPDGTWRAEEDIPGGKGGITKVRAHGRITATGFNQRSEYLKDGVWTPGHAFDYAEAAPGAVVPIKSRPARPAAK